MKLTKTHIKNGFSVIEVILAAAIFLLMATGITAVVLQGLDSNRSGEEQAVANQFASEGLEAVRSIKNQSFSNLLAGTGPGVTLAGGTWGFSPVFNTFGKYNRAITLSDVYRDGSGDIVNTGGTLDSLSKKITSVVSWAHSSTRQNSIELTTYLSNWNLPLGRKGLLVYGDGSTTSDTIRYRIFDSGNGTWSDPATTADIDGASTNRALRAVRIYTSPTRNEKVMISRHTAGTTQYIYAQVYDGTSWDSGSVILLSTFTDSTYLDVQNFSGTYLNNGNFVAVFSDNTTIPKMRQWNGSSWGSVSNLPTIFAIPTTVIAKARPNTNEIMAAFFSTDRYTTTAYFSGSSWSLHSTHATNAPIDTKKMIDFEWSGFNTSIGALVYSNASNDRRVNIRIWTANGSGGGSWGTTDESPNQRATNGTVDVTASPTAGIFSTCTKNVSNPPRITCFISNLSGVWSSPTNPEISSETAAGIQQSYDVDFEPSTGTDALAVFSDNTGIPKYKLYNPISSTWDANATSIDTAPYSFGSVETVRGIPLPMSDDILVFMADGSTDLYSVMWDGQNNSMYSTPTGKTLTRHGTNGSATTDYWYDFSWDAN